MIFIHKFNIFSRYFSNMSSPMISVCIFCFICATHSPCASHAAISEEHIFRKDIHHPGSYSSLSTLKDVPGSEKLKPYSSLNVLDSAIKNGRMHRLEKRNSDIRGSLNSGTDFNFIKKIFEIYGDGKTMNMQGFQSLLKQLNALHDLQHDHSEHLLPRQPEMLEEHNETEAINDSVRYEHSL